MGGEQREAAIALGQPVGDSPGQRETVERRCAAADLVDQHEAFGRGAVQDVRGLGHLDHDRRPSRSSAAPIRVKIASSGPNVAVSAGTNMPQYASSATIAVCRMYVDLP